MARTDGDVSDVHVTVSAADGPDGSGEIETRCGLFDAATQATSFDALMEGCGFGGAGASLAADGSHVIVAASRDASGNTEAPVVSATVRIDRTPPTVACQLPEPTFLLNAPGAIVSGVATDALSGPLSIELSQPADTSSLGQKNLTLSAADLAGNSASAVCSYNIVFDDCPAGCPVPTIDDLMATVSALVLPRAAMRGCPQRLWRQTRRSIVGIHGSHGSY